MSRCFVIAEIGVNHNGSLDLARKHVEAATDAGADAVKFQSFKAESLAVADAPKAEYQKRTTGREQSQLEMLKKLELSDEDHFALGRFCSEKGVEFMSSPFDLPAVDLLATKLNVRRIKIPSGEITNAPLLVKAARTGKPVILSTGMSVLGEIEAALGALAFGYTTQNEKASVSAFRKAYFSEPGQKALHEKVVILQCTTEYPAPDSAIHLRAMETIRAAFGLPVGLSDHSVGIAVPIAAAALGAVVIEKHVTLDRNLPGPDHAASLEPSELKAMIEGIRKVEAALGSPIKAPGAAELPNMPIARKSMVASRAVQKGEIWSLDNVTFKRPGTGLSPFTFYEIEGKTADRDYRKDEMIQP